MARRLDPEFRGHLEWDSGSGKVEGDAAHLSPQDHGSLKARCVYLYMYWLGGSGCKMRISECEC